jgi:hypothetical protein
MASVDRLSSASPQLDANEDGAKRLGQTSTFPWNKSDTPVVGRG